MEADDVVCVVDSGLSMVGVLPLPDAFRLRQILVQLAGILTHCSGHGRAGRFAACHGAVESSRAHARRSCAAVGL